MMMKEIQEHKIPMIMLKIVLNSIEKRNQEMRRTMQALQLTLKKTQKNSKEAYDDSEQIKIIYAEMQNNQ